MNCIAYNIYLEFTINWSGVFYRIFIQLMFMKFDNLRGCGGLEG